MPDTFDLIVLGGGPAEASDGACFNYPTLGDLYKYSTCDSVVQYGSL